MSEASLDLIDVCRLLQQACDRAGGQAAWAAKHGLSRQVVNDTLNTRRLPGDAIIAALGLRKVVRYAHLSTKVAA